MSSSRETLSKCRCSRRPSAASMTQRQVRLGPAAPPGSGDTMRPSVALWMVPPQDAVDGARGQVKVTCPFPICRAIAPTPWPGTWPWDDLCPTGSPPGLFSGHYQVRNQPWNRKALGWTPPPPGWRFHQNEDFPDVDTLRWGVMGESPKLKLSDGKYSG